MRYDDFSICGTLIGLVVFIAVMVILPSCTTINIRCYNHFGKEVSCKVDRERHFKQ